jgi:Tc toxin complex TcA C-terminal TcB-binding domain
VRMDYFPAPLQGVTGADLMQADLAELDATRIEGMKRTVPVRRTLSLAREFPLQYGQLKATGRCAFRTEEAFFRRAYPGTSAYRLRAISAAVQQVDFSQPLRGSLINRGVSISKPQQPGEHVLIRPSESLPLSEFRLEKDLTVYGLPNETLLTFEGSNVETFWELGFPKAANAAGLDGLVDVLLTFDLFCEFAPERYEADLLALPTSERKWILVSAAHYQPAALANLAGAAANIDVVFDLRGLRLMPQQEKSRKIKNVAVFVVTPDKIDFTARLLVTDPATSVTVTFKQGFAISTLQPDPAMPPLPASPLNALAERNPEQAFTLAISKAANPGVDFHRVTDVVLAIEYEASLV